MIGNILLLLLCVFVCVKDHISEIIVSICFSVTNIHPFCLQTFVPVLRGEKNLVPPLSGFLQTLLTLIANLNGLGPAAYQLDVYN